MLANGRYFAFIIFEMGMILVAQDISEKDEKKFIEDILDAHNYFRYKHASGPLKLDDELCKKAKERAHELKSPNFKNFPIGKYDENYSITDFDGTSYLDTFKIVSSWYAYGNFYDYNEEPFERVIDIFSKIVWKNTKRIGVGILVSDKKCYVAVIYSPCGCQIGQYFSNIIHPDVAAVINQQETDRLLGDLVKESE